MPTDKQANFIMSLLAQKGYSTKYMNAQFKALGATMRERSGRVEDWVRRLSVGDASKLIDQLQKL